MKQDPFRTIATITTSAPTTNGSMRGVIDYGGSCEPQMLYVHARISAGTSFLRLHDKHNNTVYKVAMRLLASGDVTARVVANSFKEDAGGTSAFKAATSVWLRKLGHEPVWLFETQPA